MAGMRNMMFCAGGLTLAAIVFFVVMIAVFAVLTLWALNTLFNLNIPYDAVHIIALFILLAVLKSELRRG